MLDRIVDYITVLETILVPEKDFLGRRLRERAAALLRDKQIDIDDTKHLLRDFYNIRSVIVHGSDISSSKDSILKRNMDFEQVVRHVIVESLRVVPIGVDRDRFLKNLFDIGDETRSEKVYNNFCSIKNNFEKTKCFERISERLQKKLT